MWSLIFIWPFAHDITVLNVQWLKEANHIFNLEIYRYSKIIFPIKYLIISKE